MLEKKQAGELPVTVGPLHALPLPKERGGGGKDAAALQHHSSLRCSSLAQGFLLRGTQAHDHGCKLIICAAPYAAHDRLPAGPVACLRVWHPCAAVTQCAQRVCLLKAANHPAAAVDTQQLLLLLLLRLLLLG